MTQTMFACITIHGSHMFVTQSTFSCQKEAMQPLKISNLAKKHKPNTTWSQEARIAAVSQYLVLGNMALVSSVTKIPHQLLRSWKQQPWWAEIEQQVRATENLQMDSKLSKIVDKSLDAVLDRLENGEFVYNQKTGEIVRKQVNMKDAAKVSVDLITKRELLRGNATSRTEATQIPIEDQLKALALEFAKWQKPKEGAMDIIDVVTSEVVDYAVHEEWEEGLRSGSEVGEDDPSPESEAESGEEFSSEPDDGSWESS